MDMGELQVRPLVNPSGHMVVVSLIHTDSALNHSDVGECKAQTLEFQLLEAEFIIQVPAITDKFPMSVSFRQMEYQVSYLYSLCSLMVFVWLTKSASRYPHACGDVYTLSEGQFLRFQYNFATRGLNYPLQQRISAFICIT